MSNSCPEVMKLKASLVVKIIEAHCGKNEVEFKESVERLALDEEKKGNLSVAHSIRESYNTKSNRSNKVFKSNLDESFFITNSNVSLPKDKDSALELLEILTPTVSLREIALPIHTRETIEQIIYEQKNLDKLTQGGIAPINRIIFYGPPGVGKTLSAMAIAKELNIPVAYVKLDGLISSFLGQTGSNLRRIFDYVKNRRIMLFLDEFDAIAKKRDDSNELGELKRVVTTLLQNMDLMPHNVVLVAATNHHHLLDSAIWRRFNISIELKMPNYEQRDCMVRNFLESKTVEYKVDFKLICLLTDGMNGSEIKEFCNSITKHRLLSVESDEIKNDQIMNLWYRYNGVSPKNNDDELIKLLRKLKDSGLSIRNIEEITGIPRSTLSYKFGKGDRIDEQ